MVSIPVHGGQTSNELQPPNSTQHWSRWRPCGHPNSSPGVPGGHHALTCLGIWSLKGCRASAFRGSSSPKGPRRSSRLDLPRDPILRRPSRLDLRLDLPGDLISRRLSCLSLPGDLHPDVGTPGSQVATVLGRISFKKPIVVCHKCYQLGHWAALCPRDPRASRSSAKPSLTMVQED